MMINLSISFLSSSSFRGSRIGYFEKDKFKDQEKGDLSSSNNSQKDILLSRYQIVQVFQKIQNEKSSSCKHSNYHQEPLDDFRWNDAEDEDDNED